MLRQTLLKNSPSPKDHLINRYIKFIDDCRGLTFTCYTEKHHIIPKSFGGDDNKNNILRIGARHHYIAHLLLARATNSPKMIKALHKMAYSKTGNVCRDYKISSRIYSYIREEHAKIVSAYSKNTVVAKQIYTDEIKRIPKKLFDYYNGILYEAIAKGRTDSLETKRKKQLASKRPRKVRQGLRSRSIASSKYSYYTPKGFCEGSTDLLNLYSSFTHNTLTVIDNGVIITHKFASIHKEFDMLVGKTFEEAGITKFKRRKDDSIR